MQNIKTLFEQNHNACIFHQHDDSRSFFGMVYGVWAVGFKNWARLSGHLDIHGRGLHLDRRLGGLDSNDHENWIDCFFVEIC